MPLCAIKLRDAAPCGLPTTHIVVTPWGARKDVCADCARSYAATSGFIVREANSACMACGGAMPLPNAILYCWCGGSPAKRFRVGALWYSLCSAHEAPSLSSLWRRQLQALLAWILKPFQPKPKQMSAAEIVDLTEAARRRAKRR